MKTQLTLHCRLFSFYAPHRPTAPAARELLLVGTNVLCDKDQGITGPAAKDKAPSEREFKDK